MVRSLAQGHAAELGLTLPPGGGFVHPFPQERAFPVQVGRHIQVLSDPPHLPASLLMQMSL